MYARNLQAQIFNADNEFRFLSLSFFTLNRLSWNLENIIFQRQYAFIVNTIF